MMRTALGTEMPVFSAPVALPVRPPQTNTAFMVPQAAFVAPPPVQSVIPPPNTYSQTPQGTPAQIPNSSVQIEQILRNRLLTRLQEDHRKWQLELEHLMDETQQLLTNEKRINDSINVIRADTQKLEALEKEVKSTTEKTNIGNIDPEGVMIPANEIAGQLLDLSVRDLALSDCLYALSKTLFDGNTSTSHDLNALMKQLRVIARDQFMTRAHVQKIRLMYPILPIE